MNACRRETKRKKQVKEKSFLPTDKRERQKLAPSGLFQIVFPIAHLFHVLARFRAGLHELYLMLVCQLDNREDERERVRDTKSK